jgi:nitronate monooxygenase
LLKVSGNYLKPSVVNAGMDPGNLQQGSVEDMNFDPSSEKPKAWSQIFGCGQGIASIKSIESVAEFVHNLDKEFKTTVSEFKLKF